MATTKITDPGLFDLASLDSALQLPSGTTAQRPASPSTGEWRYNTDDNKIEFYDGSFWLTIQDEDIPPVPSENFSIVTYTGNGATQSITGVGFQPDFVWIKDYSQARNHIVFDSSRGVQKRIIPNATNAEATLTDGLSSFDSDGFSIGSNVNVNANAAGYVAWCWKLNGGTTSSNSDGNITTTVQVNTKTKSSIVQGTATGGLNATNTFGHGLGTTPAMIILKQSDGIAGWLIWHQSFSNTAQDYLVLNSTNGKATAPEVWANSAPTSTVFSATNGWTYNTNGTIIAYCFAEVAGYSKFGSYTGSSTNDFANIFVSTGFKPTFVMIKQTNVAGANWLIFDNYRANGGFLGEFQLNPNNTSEEYKNNNNPAYVLFTEDGFEVNGNTQSINGNGASYVYAAFAADPTTTSPTLSDSFNIQTYDGDASTYKDITGYGLAPTLVWAKNRNSGNWNTLKDRIRSSHVKSFLSSNLNNDSQGTGPYDAISEFLTDGWQASSNWNGSSAGLTNQSGLTYVGWGWKANNDSATRNTSGTITSIVSANTAAGFSVVKYTGNNTAGATVGHGLSATPDVIIIKRRDNGVGYNWIVGHSSLSFTSNETLSLDVTNAIQTWNYFNATTPTSTVFTLGTGANTASTNSSGGKYIAYCFNSVSGFSKFGSYTGNGGTQAITGLGFSPDCVIVKSATFAEVWSIFDTARGPNRRLTPSGADQEYIDSGGGYLQSFDSDGFTVQAGASNAANVNQNAETYIYLAWKANPTHGGVSAGKMAYLVVAGGGSGGWNSATWDGAGGGGGVTTSYGTESGGSSPVEPSLTLASGTYTITIGAGGFSNSGAVSANGNNSTITGNATITAIGGGGGGDVTTSPLGKGRDGGSGGGGSNYSGNPLGGSGEPAQGYQGGQGSSSNGGGGGGAGKPGLSNGTGGDGIYCSISGTATYYAGGAAGYNGTGTPGQGGGGTPSSAPGGANTGGGGAGTRTATSADGGSGIVILRLKTSEYSGTVTGSPTVTTDGDETILTYTGSGTYVH